MLENLYKSGYLHFEKIILDNTKALGLIAEEAVILIYLLKEYSKTGVLSIDKLSNYLLMNSSKIDKLVASLMERGFYEVYLSYDNGKGTECVSFKPLFEKIEKIIMNEKETIDPYDISKAIEYVSSKLNRVLTASELEILQALMFEDHYTYDQIVTAVDTIIEGKRVLSMRSLTQTLAKKKTEAKPKVEAPAALKDFFNKI